jgi:uncharacterized protein YcbK (DUF882 family)
VAAGSALDATERHIAQLTPRVAALAVDLVNAARTAGYPLIITSSTRSFAQQRALVRAGRSQRLDSLHLTGRAFDVDLRGLPRDSVPSWFWNDLGPFAERLGLRWGGRWRRPFDPGHFEL